MGTTSLNKSREKKRISPLEQARGGDGMYIFVFDILLFFICEAMDLKLAN